MLLTVTPTTDRDEIRRRLQADRVWSIYALADLDADLFPLCQWWICGDGGLALQFSGISILPIFITGSADEVRRLLEELLGRARLPESARRALQRGGGPLSI